MAATGPTSRSTSCASSPRAGTSASVERRPQAAHGRAGRRHGPHPVHRGGRDGEGEVPPAAESVSTAPFVPGAAVHQPPHGLRGHVRHVHGQHDDGYSRAFPGSPSPLRPDCRSPASGHRARRTSRRPGRRTPAPHAPRSRRGRWAARRRRPPRWRASATAASARSSSGVPSTSMPALSAPPSRSARPPASTTASKTTPAVWQRGTLGVMQVTLVQEASTLDPDREPGAAGGADARRQRPGGVPRGVRPRLRRARLGPERCRRGRRRPVRHRGRARGRGARHHGAGRDVRGRRGPAAPGQHARAARRSARPTTARSTSTTRSGTASPTASPPAR